MKRPSPGPYEKVYGRNPRRVPEKLWAPVPSAQKDREDILALVPGLWDGRDGFPWKVVKSSRFSAQKGLLRIVRKNMLQFVRKCAAIPMMFRWFCWHGLPGRRIMVARIIATRFIATGPRRERRKKQEKIDDAIS